MLITCNHLLLDNMESAPVEMDSTTTIDKGKLSKLRSKKPGVKVQKPEEAKSTAKHGDIRLQNQH